MTQEFLQDAIVEDLEQLFSHYTLTNSMGVNRKIQVFSQFLPFREGDDEETDAEEIGSAAGTLCAGENAKRRTAGAGRTAKR